MGKHHNGNLLNKGNKKPKTKKEVIEWGGYRWVPNYEGYHRCWQRGPMYQKRLHKAFWESINGPVPKGYDIDHIDSNKSNSVDITNLQMLTTVEHAKKSNHRKAWLKEHFEKERETTQAEPWDEDPIEKGGEEE